MINRSKVAGVIACIAYTAAKRSANTTCFGLFGQSRLPDRIKKLRKS